MLIGCPPPKAYVSSLTRITLYSCNTGLGSERDEDLPLESRKHSARNSFGIPFTHSSRIHLLAGLLLQEYKVILVRIYDWPSRNNAPSHGANKI